MIVKDIIASALTLLGRADVASALNNNYWQEWQELIDTLLYCFNAVEDELARKYIPLSTKEEMTSENFKYYYSEFNYRPVKIKRVKADGKYVKFKAFTQYMEVQAKIITVEYEYAPNRKKFGDCSDYDGEVSEYLIALGIASEYSFINGEAEAAGYWEKQYRARIDSVQRTLPACENIPPRRWV